MSCLKETTTTETGKKPVYITKDNFLKVDAIGAQAFENVGKIFVLGNTIYISDKGKGVHIIDNSDPSNPTKTNFISIYANNDVAVKNNILFADNSSDLIAIDISDLNNVKTTKRITNVFVNTMQDYPQDYNGVFECVDKSKGYVIDWVDADLKNPECRR